MLTLSSFLKKDEKTEDEKPRSALQEGLNLSSRRNRIKGNEVMEDTAARGGGGEELGCTTPSVRTGGCSAAQVRVLSFGSNWCNACCIEVLCNFTLLTSCRCYSPQQTQTVIIPGQSFFIIREGAFLGNA